MSKSPEIADMESAVGVSAPRRRMREYRLMFRASEQGLAKRVEFSADGHARAVELALADAAQRTVDIWEDGEFLCQVSRESCAEEGEKLIGDAPLRHFRRSK